MLKSIYIENNALIEKLEINFSKGLSIITGETGAGKSILLGAMSLILGKRADTGVLYDKESKCIVEGIFDISEFKLSSFYSDNDIDYDNITYLRREILPNGKSRAFINDTPVNLNELAVLGVQLVDQHSQYQNLQLNNYQYQLQVIDRFCKSEDVLKNYKNKYNLYQKNLSAFNKLFEESENLKSDLDYYQFQFNQLNEAKMTETEKDDLELEQEQLANAEEIKGNIINALNILSNDENTLLDQLRAAINFISKIRKFLPESSSVENRMESAYIELKDIAEEIESLNDKMNIDPKRLEFVNERLDIIYTLLQKHKVTDVKELMNIKGELEKKIITAQNVDFNLDSLKKEVKKSKTDIEIIAGQLSDMRQLSLNVFSQEVKNILQEMNMPHAKFEVKHETLNDFAENGTDKVLFLFSANKNAPLQEISKVASGGEISRLMLSIKSLISDAANLPTIIFDEIDTGVSGEIADKVGNIIKNMSQTMQVINITHLPQVASKGDSHYLVYKDEGEKRTTTKVKVLNIEERHIEIARMLSGEELTDAALANARELLKN